MRHRVIALALVATFCLPSSGCLPVQAQVTQPVSTAGKPEVGKNAPTSKTTGTGDVSTYGRSAPASANQNKNLTPGSPVPVFPVPINTGTSSAGATSGSAASGSATSGSSTSGSSTSDSTGGPESRPQVPTPPPSSSLGDLYPESKTQSPYSASSTDPGLTDKQKDEAKSVTLMPIPVGELLPIGERRLPPIKLEAVYNDAISLKEVLDVTLKNNLPLRISQTGYENQKYLFWGSLGRFLPDFTMTYRNQEVDNSGQNTPPNKITTTSTTLRYPVYQGGAVLFGAMLQGYRAKAFKQAYFASINDALLAAYQGYYNLVLTQTILQIRVKSVEISRAQLALNEQLKSAGVGTNFAIYQSRTQLALDKQALLQAQVDLRQAALTLARVMNISLAVNLMPQESNVRELRLIRPTTSIDELINLTWKHRPELKQYEYLRLAANRNIQVQQAPLLPQFQFFTSLTDRGNTGSGGTSTVVIPGGGGGGGIGISGAGRRSFTWGYDLNWNLPSMGVPTYSNTLAARALARQALLQSNDQYLTVMQQVRSSYLNMVTTNEQVDVAAEAVVSASEQLRLANLRVTYGQGINLELIQAQRDYITAFTNHAQAIIRYNIAQAQLLRDTGMISVNTLTTEFPQPISLNGGATTQ